MRCRFAALLAVLCALSAAQAEVKKLAVITEPDTALQQAGDVLAASLAQIPGVEMLERDRISTVVREFALAEILGADSTRKRLDLGNLLAADLLVFVNADKLTTPERPFARMTICDCRSGARLAQEEFPLPINAAQFGQRGRELVEAVRARFANGITALVAVAPLRSKNLGYEYNHLQNGFANVLRTALLGASGLVVLEVDEAQAIQRELGLAGIRGTSGLPAVLFVSGEFRVEPGAKQPVVKLTLNRGEGAAAAVSRDFAGIDAATAYLRGEYAAELIRAAAGGGAPLANEQLVARLAEQADRFTAVGQLYKAIRLRETILLLRPQQGGQTLQLISECAGLIPYRERLVWNERSSDAAQKDAVRKGVAERLDLWRRGLDHVRTLIDQRLATQAAVLSALRRLDRALSDFHDRANIETDFDRLQDEELLGAFRSELDACVRARSAFVAGAGLRIRDLEPGDPEILNDRRPTDLGPDPVRARPPQAFAAREIRRSWASYLADHPVKQAAFRPSALELLEQEVWCLLGPLSDEPSFYPSARFEQLLADADGRRSISSEPLEGLIARLESSTLVPAQIHGRLYRILFDRCVGKGGQKASADEALKRLTEWETAATNAKFQSVAQRAKRVRALLVPESEANPLAAAPTQKSVSGTTGQAVAKKDTQKAGPAPNLDIAETPMQIRRPNGQTAPLLRPGMEVDEAPEAVLAADGFDIFWNSQFIFLHQTAGTLNQIYAHNERDHPGVRSVVYDGANIWAITCCQGVYVFDSQGRQVAQLKVGESLPAAHAGASLAVIERNKVLAAGSFGLDKRAWCATLTLKGDQLSSEVIHEATTAYTDPKELATSYADPKAVFIPAAIYRIAAAADAKPTFLVQRSLANPRSAYAFQPGFLKVDPAGRTATVVDYKLPRFTIGNRSPRHAFIGGDCLMIDRDAIKRYPAPGARPARSSELLSVPGQRLESDFLRVEDQYYIRGETWYRLDPATMQVDAVGRWPDTGPKLNTRNWAGVSAIHGLITWDWEGRYCRVLGALPEGEAQARTQAAVEQLREKVSGEKKDAVAWKQLVLELYDANRGDEARAACMQWIGQFPQLLEARYALHDVERKRRSGLGRWDYDDKLAKGPFPSFAVWRLYCDPDRSTGDAGQLKNALRLPIAEDADQWMVAEMGLFSAALGFVERQRSNDAIAVCDQWQREAEQRGAASNAGYFLLRAIARLNLGDFDAARPDAQAAAEAEKAGRSWATDAQAVLKEIDAKNKAFKYRLEPSLYDRRCWWELAASP